MVHFYHKFAETLEFVGNYTFTLEFIACLKSKNQVFLKKLKNRFFYLCFYTEKTSKNSQKKGIKDPRFLNKFLKPSSSLIKKGSK